MGWQRHSFEEQPMADFIPEFEGNWAYQSFAVLPTAPELAAAPGSPVTAKKWAMGKLRLADSVEMAAAGMLTFLPGVELRVQVRFVPGPDGAPARFEATGKGESGPMVGVEYELVGWALPSPAGRLQEVRGSVRAVKGAGAGLGGLPVGTVGSFVISKSN
jgi:hypothetical protein